MSSLATINYTFNAGAKTITILDFDSDKNPLNPTLINLIFNETTHQSIYKITDALNYTVLGNVITLTGSTAGMSDSDKLRIEYGQVFSPASSSGLIEDGTDLEITCAGYNTITFSLEGSSEGSLAASVDGGVTYGNVYCYNLDGQNQDNELFAGNSYTTSITGVTDLKFVFTGGAGAGFINVGFTLSKDITTMPLAAVAQQNTLYDVGVLVEHINDKTPALGQALAAGSVPVVLTAAQMSDLASEGTLSDIDITTLGMQTLLGSLNTKSPNQGRAAAGSSLPVVLCNEDVQDLNFTGQAGQINTINNVLTTTAGSAAIDVNGYSSGAIQLSTSGTVSSGTCLLEGSNDNTTFYVIPAINQAIPATAFTSIGMNGSAGNSIIIFAIDYRYIRLRISAAMVGGGSMQAVSRFSKAPFANSRLITFATGTAAHSAAASGNPVLVAGVVTTTPDITLTNGDTCYVMMGSNGALLNKPYGSAENDWVYAAAASGIVNTTTAVTIKTAGGASIRNYVTAIQVYAEALGAATELAIRDGAAGTVLWRTKIPAGGTTQTFPLPTPLKGTAATLLEVVTLTASITGAVYFNAQGYQSF